MSDVPARAAPRRALAETSPARPSATHWYRYQDERGEEDFGVSAPPRIRLLKYRVIGETPKTVLLEKPGFDWSSGRPVPLTRRVLKVARKRFAYPTTELAMKSFRIRKQRQLGWLRSDIEHVEAVLFALTEADPTPTAAAEATA